MQHIDNAGLHLRLGVRVCSKLGMGLTELVVMGLGGLLEGLGVSLRHLLSLVLCSGDSLARLLQAVHKNCIPPGVFDRHPLNILRRGYVGIRGVQQLKLLLHDCLHLRVALLRLSVSLLIILMRDRGRFRFSPLRLKTMPRVLLVLLQPVHRGAQLPAPPELKLLPAPAAPQQPQTEPQPTKPEPPPDKGKRPWLADELRLALQGEDPERAKFSKPIPYPRRFVP